MYRPVVTLLAAGIGTIGLAWATIVPGRAAALSSPASSLRPGAAHGDVLSSSEARAVIEQYCLTCHDQDHAKGDLVLETFDPAKADQRGDVAEKMVRKLRAGMMPPPGAERPAEGTLDAFAASLEMKLDAAAELHPDPGHRTFQRLNRAEYTQEIHDILGLDVDAATFLPPDTISHAARPR